MKARLIQTGLAIAAFFAATATGQAADLPYKAPSYVAPSYSNWSGFYVGVNGGYGWGTSDWDVPAVSPEPKGWLLGGTLGYNFQTGVWVWGVEADIAYSTIDGSVGCGAGTCQTALNWFGTARGRIGYGGWGSIMPYITGGAAFGEVEATNSNFGTTASDTRFGWTLGAGLEYALFTNWSVKVEYLYVDLGSFDCGASCGGPGVTTDNVSYKMNVVRAGLNYRF